MVEGADAHGVGPELAQRQVVVLESDVELRLVLDRALHPAVPGREFLGGRGNGHPLDLDGVRTCRQTPFGVANIVGGGVPSQCSRRVHCR